MEPLVAEHVSRQFGGLKAVRDVCFSMQPGERRALIGPNGAGKTTLFNLVAGQLTPTSGRILLFGQDVTRVPPFRRAALGLARTFQITNLFKHLTVAENLNLAVQALQPKKYAVHRPLTSYADVTGRTEHLLKEWRVWGRPGAASPHPAPRAPRARGGPVAAGGRAPPPPPPAPTPRPPPP